MIFNNVLELIGNTPMLKINNLASGENVKSDIYVKLEKFNPAGSIKDRAALNMIEKAEEAGVIKKGDIIIEPTSGNTGIALAMVGRIKGYKVKIIMPDTMSVERRLLIKAYGAELVLTEGALGMKGAIEKANEMASIGEGVFIPNQFRNENNPLKHYEQTANEIIKDLKDVDIFIAGVGTGGTIAGVGRKLKEINKNIQIIAVEPKKSPVLSGGQAGPHKIQGIGAGFIPEIYDKTVVDQIIQISDEEAYLYSKKMAIEEGALVGISSGANIAAAIKLAKNIDIGKKIVTVAPDGGEKYISMNLYE